MKSILTITSLLMLCASIFVLAAGSTAAQTEERSQELSAAEINSPESATCHTTVTFGSGGNKIKICISAHGNLIDFESPAGFEHLTNSESQGDGYVLCSSLADHGYDDGVTEAGFGLNPIITQPGGPNTLPLTIVRQTTDSMFRLTQTFEWDTAEKDVTITMILKNRSASAISGIKLARYFEGDLDNTVASDIYDRSNDSVWGRETHALSLTALTQAIPHLTAVETLNNWSSSTRSTCTPVHTVVPNGPGFFVGRLTYNLGSISPNASKTVKMLYRRH